VQHPAYGGDRRQLVDHVSPPLPVRQWVLSVPRRPRWYLEQEPKAVTAVLHLFLRVVEAYLRKRCPGAAAQVHFGAVNVVHRFGSSLNRQLHHGSQPSKLAGLPAPHGKRLHQRFPLRSFPADLSSPAPAPLSQIKAGPAPPRHGHKSHTTIAAKTPSPRPRDPAPKEEEPP
jgi:hypothetical protein